jgi:predicted  nucleic acid-binding Zn-ribbon protein
VSTTRQFRVFLFLTAALTIAFFAWGWLRWHGQAPERNAWAAVQGDLEAQSARIDSLKLVLSGMDREVSDAKRDISSAGERLGHWGRQAVGGRLPAAERRQYLREIERHNQAVAEHNAALASMQRVYAEYSALVDTHNVLVDSANVLQRRAVQEGIQLSTPAQP